LFQTIADLAYYYSLDNSLFLERCGGSWSLGRRQEIYKNVIIGVVMKQYMTVYSQIQVKLNVGGVESSAAFKDVSRGRKFTVHL